MRKFVQSQQPARPPSPDPTLAGQATSIMSVREAVKCLSLLNGISQRALMNLDELAETVSLAHWT